MDFHGQGDGSYSGRLVRYEATGPFNYEGILSLRGDIDKIAISNDGDPWGVICIMSGDSLFTPEAEEAHRVFISDMYSRGLKTVSYILAGHSARKVFEAQIRRIYDGTGVSLSLFDDEPAATRTVIELLENL